MTIFEDEVCRVIMLEVNFVREIAGSQFLNLIGIGQSIGSLSIICIFAAGREFSVWNFDHDNSSICDFIEFSGIISENGG